MEEEKDLNTKLEYLAHLGLIPNNNQPQLLSSSDNSNAHLTIVGPHQNYYKNERNFSTPQPGSSKEVYSYSGPVQPLIVYDAKNSQVKSKMDKGSGKREMRSKAPVISKPVKNTYVKRKKIKSVRKRISSDIKKNIRKGFGNGVYLAERIVDKRMEADGEPRYLIKWEGYSSKVNTWEPKVNVSEDLIKDFEFKKRQVNVETFSVPPKLTKASGEFQHVKSIDTGIKNDRDDKVKILSSYPEDSKAPVAGSPIVKKMPKLKKMANKKVQNIESIDKLSKESGIRKSGDQSQIQRAVLKAPQKLIQPVSPKQKLNSNDLKHVTPVVGKKLQKIIGATQDKGETYFLVSFEDSDSYVFVKSDLIKTTFPVQVVDFYEENITWKINYMK